ncbi:kynurenine--oxoglutarate transaminase 3 isoform X2 [Notamacropus eugenii]|uniref:kynurenine--oxoglutarate transaminase 3 isoform X2 n=1 Tax=Notamacropus eugenii TaxID=9315 RepID=UPI003B671EA0
MFLIQRCLSSLNNKTELLKITHASGRFCFSASAKMSKKFKNARRIEGLDDNVWVEFFKLSSDPAIVDLGQGRPDISPPKYIQEELAKAAAIDSLNQYTRGFGHPSLVEALSSLYGKIYDRQIDPNHETIVTVGAYGSLFNAIQGLVNEEEERPTKGNGGSSASWILDLEELESKFSSKTKVLIINTPHNPTGKIFSKEELQGIADLCIKHDIICISDEVYEWLVYTGKKHIKIATLPGMWERTITVGSAGKTFSVTGWKLGWSIGPKDLIRQMQIVQQNVIDTCATPLQEALARAFWFDIKRMNDPECYFYSLPLELEAKRDRMVQLLQSVGLKPIVPEGGYFIIADASGLNVDLSEMTDECYDYKIAKWMIKNKKLTTIPVTAFCNAYKKDFEKYIRFCFIKKDSTLDAFEKIIKTWAKEF